MYEIRLKCFRRRTSKEAYKNELENFRIKLQNNHYHFRGRHANQSGRNVSVPQSVLQGKLGNALALGFAHLGSLLTRHLQTKKTIQLQTMLNQYIHASAWYQIHNIMMVSTSADFDDWWVS